MSRSYRAVRPFLASTLAVGAIGLISMTAAVGGSGAAAAASADSLVYVKDGKVYLAQSDGTQARAITDADNGWAWHDR